MIESNAWRITLEIILWLVRLPVAKFLLNHCIEMPVHSVCGKPSQLKSQTPSSSLTESWIWTGLQRCLIESLPSSATCIGHLIQWSKKNKQAEVSQRFLGKYFLYWQDTKGFFFFILNIAVMEEITAAILLPWGKGQKNCTDIDSY